MSIISDSNAPLEELIIEPSIDDTYIQNQKKKPWYTRTFAKMEKGSVRGNIFLMIITTTGCAFFYLPYQSKQTGILLTFLLLLFPAAVSYYSSGLLYLGFKATKAKTYDECMDKILGKKLGFLSNVMMFIHTFAAVVSVWLFSFEFLFKATKTIFDVEDTSYFKFFYIYCAFMGTLLYLSSVAGNVLTLKKISMVGILIIIYLIIVFIALLPTYFKFYREKISVTLFTFDISVFRTNGICFYLFLNQYTVLPICNSLKSITTQRITKIIRRTNLISLTIYILITFIGFFSIPDFEYLNKDYELFLLRPKITDTDYYVVAGQILFGFNLIICVLVKGHFFALYFHQLVRNISRFFRKIYRGQKKNKIIDNRIKENNEEEQMNGGQDIEEIIEQEIEEKKIEKLEEKIEKIEEKIKEEKKIKKILDDEEKKLETKSLIHISVDEGESIRKKKISLKNKLKRKLTEPNLEDRLTYNFNMPDVALELTDKKKKEERVKHYILNLFFFIATTFLTIAIRSVLHKFVSLVGSFVGVFEIIIFPVTMILVINSKNRILTGKDIVLLLIISVIFVGMGLASFVTNLFF